MAIWEVLDLGGKVLCQCGWEGDAAMLAAIVPGRTYRRMQRLAPEIIDVLAIREGELPGNLGLPGRGAPLEGVVEGVLTPGVGVALG